MKIFAETDRLILREIMPADRNGLFAIDSDPDVNKYLGKKPVETIEQIDDVIAFIRKQYIDNGIGRWAMIERDSNNFIGWCGLKLVKELTNKHINYYDLGYRLNKNYWGKSLGTEAANATLQYGFNIMKLKDMYAIADSENIASKNILQKVGLKYVNTFKLDDTDHDWFEVHK
ncbi:MAG: GNAT family N-acetyltransferase [Bacteroidia bacterium]